MKRIKSSSPQHQEMPNPTWLKIWRMGAIILTLAAVAFVSVMPQVTNDFWLQAKVGELIVRDRAIPATLLFPFTPIQSATFNAHEWLPSILFFEFIQLFGEGALPLILGGLCLVLFGVMVKLVQLKSDGNLPWAMMLGLMAVAVENQRNFLRPELLSLILMGVYWYLLERCRRKKSAMDFAGALFIVVVWANTHGSFILAPIIAAIYAIGGYADRFRHSNSRLNYPASVADARFFAYLAVAALAGTLATPFGWDMLKFVFEYGNSSMSKQHIMEWLPTFDDRFLSSRGWWIGMGAILLAAGFLVKRWRDASAIEILMFVFFTVLAFKAVRFLVYTGMVAAFVMASLAPRQWETQRGQLRLFAIGAGLGAATLFLAMTYGNVFGAYPHSSPNSQSFTRFMVEELNKPDLRGNVLTSYDLGAELVYRSYPRLRPSIDSRIDSYGDEYFDFHRHLMLDDALLTRFAKEYDVRYMLLNYSDFRALMKLPNWTENHWEIRFRDQRTVLLQRREAAR